MENSTSGLTPFIDTAYFDFEYGDTGAGERIIDSQWATSTIYESTAWGKCHHGNWPGGMIGGFPMPKKIIVDYSRSPNTSGSPAIAPLFSVTGIINEAGQTDYPFYWSSTTHANLSSVPGANAAYGFLTTENHSKIF